MFRSKLAGLFVAAALAMGLNAGSAEAGFVSHHGSAGFRANPGLGRGGAFRHSSTTAVRGTPGRPGVGPIVTHRSRTAGFRR